MPTLSRGRSGARSRFAGGHGRPFARGVVEALEGRTLLTAAPGPIGADLQVSTATQAKDTPALALDAAGDFVAVWKSVNQDGSLGGIYARRFDADGAPQGDEFRVNTRTADNQDTPSVARDAAGNTVVVWMSNGQDGSQGGIYAQRYDAGGLPLGGEFRVNSITAGDQTAPDVAVDRSSGDFVVAWHGPDGVYVRRFSGAGVAAGPETRANAALDANTRSPQVAYGPGGTFVAAWHRVAKTGAGAVAGEVDFQRFDASGARWGDTVVVSTAAPGRTPYASDVGIDAAGDVVVAWDDRAAASPDYKPYDVYVRRYPASGDPAGPAASVASLLPAGTGAPVRLAVGPAGNFVVTFEASLGPTTERMVFQRAYDAAGDAFYTPLLATWKFGNKTSPAVALADDGRFVMAWVFKGNGVAAQRYAPVDNPASVGDFVWNDRNLNGIQDAGEPPLDGVTVRLLTPAGAQAGIAATSADGHYRIDNLRGGDPYVLNFQATGYSRFTVPDAGPDDLDSDASRPANLPSGVYSETVPFTVPAGGVDLTWDAGLLPPVTIQGLVWDDANGNGIREDGEAGRDGVWVDLYDPSGQSRGGATTSGGGKYSFYNLPAGPYRLKFNLPPEPGLSFTARDQGTDDTVDSDVDASGAYTDFFTVPPGDADRTRDAGLAPRRAVTGFAYSDDDGDGRRTDADAPLPALAVFSDDNANGAFDPGEAWTTTYGDGGYSLQLTPGTHLIAVATPPGRTLTTPPDARTVTVASGDVVGGLDLAVAPAPRATHLYVRGARWQPAFRQALAAAGLGDAAYGFEVTDPARPADVPWANIDQVSVRFDAPAAPDSTSLAAYGVRVPGYAINGYRYDADTNTGTWSLSAPLGTDRDRFELPGFQRRLAVLVGDANGDGKTNALDILEMRRRLNSTAAAGAGYRVFADIDGSGRIDARDLAVARLDRSSALPPEPASVSATGVAGATTDLFSRAPVLPT